VTEERRPEEFPMEQRSPLWQDSGANEIGFISNIERGPEVWLGVGKFQFWFMLVLLLTNCEALASESLQALFLSLRTSKCCT
jgi:hypothetical protein